MAYYLSFSFGNFHNIPNDPKGKHEGSVKTRLLRVIDYIRVILQRLSTFECETFRFVDQLDYNSFYSTL